MGAFAIKVGNWITFQTLCCKSSMLSMTNDFVFASFDEKSSFFPAKYVNSVMFTLFTFKFLLQCWYIHLYLTYPLTITYLSCAGTSRTEWSVTGTICSYFFASSSRKSPICLSVDTCPYPTYLYDANNISCKLGKPYSNWHKG